MIVEKINISPLPDKKLIWDISDKHKINPIVSALLIQKGIKSDFDIDMFLNPGKNYLHDPFNLKDIEKGVKLLEENRDKRVWVFGDYDVDGITSCAIVYTSLLKLGFSVKWYVPDRIDEGYDLNINAIDKIIEKGCDLLITTDCGSNALEAVEYAKSKNIKVLVTDHHKVDTKSNPHALINPMQEECPYPFKRLSGAGVAYKLIMAYVLKHMLDPWAFTDSVMDLLCLSTVADIMPLVDENRIFVKLGLKKIEKTNKCGLAGLLREAYLFKNISAKDLSFKIIPKFNSAGRMGKSDLGFRLLIENDLEHSLDLCKEVNDLNNNRLELEEKMFQEAVEIIEKENYDKYSVLVVYNQEWLHSICGNIASKLCKKYSKPSLVIGGKDNLAIGSGRDKGDLDLHGLLSQCSPLLERFGGHKSAVGFTIKPENIENLRIKLNEIYKKPQETDDLTCDLNIKPEVIDLSLCQEIESLGPFGEGNKEPLFTSKNLVIKTVSNPGKEHQHTKLVFEVVDKRFLEGVIWNFTDDNLKPGVKVDIAYNLQINEFNFQRNPQMLIKGLKLVEE